MKKIIYFICAVFSFLFIIPYVSAATSTISAAKQVEVGHSVKATVTVNAAAWNIKINGTGNTNGCSAKESDVSKNGNNVKQYISVSCTANSTGIIKVSYSGDITDANGSTKDVSGSVTINVVAARPKSSNNYLKSLSVEGSTLSPDFNKDTLEYSVILEAGTEKAIINAEKEDGYASLVGTGEKDVVEGDNRFEVVVTSETGSSRTYIVNITVKEFSPIIVNIGNKQYTVVRKIQDITKPENYDDTTIQIGEDTIQALRNENINKTLVVLKDEAGKTYFFEYKDGKYIKYTEIKSSSLTISIENMDTKILPKGYEKYTEVINDEEVEVYKYSKDSSFGLVYALNVVTGKKDLYQIDLKNNTVQLYNGEADQKIETNSKNSLIIFAIAGGVILLEFLIILASRKKNKRIINKLKDNKMAKVKKEAIKESKKESIDKKDLKTEEIKLDTKANEIIDEEVNKKKKSK